MVTDCVVIGILQCAQIGIVGVIIADHHCEAMRHCLGQRLLRYGSQAHDYCEEKSHTRSGEARL